MITEIWEIDKHCKLEPKDRMPNGRLVVDVFVKGFSLGGASIDPKKYTAWINGEVVKINSKDLFIKH